MYISFLLPRRKINSCSENITKILPLEHKLNSLALQLTMEEH